MQFDSLLDNPLPHFMPVMTLGINTMLPIGPAQPPGPWPQHSFNTTGNEIHTHRPVGVTIERLPGILRVTFYPDMIKRDDLRGLETGFSGHDAVAGETYDTLNSDILWVYG